MMIYSESRSEQKLFSILNEEERKIHALQAQFWKEWNNCLELKFGTSIDILTHACVFGGFTLTPEEFEKLNCGLAEFFRRYGKFGNGLWNLRGYSYYAADPFMYLTDKIPSDYERWETVMARWSSYTSVLSYSSIDVQMSFYDWIGWLSLLEYMLNDLTTMYWTIKKISMESNFSGDMEDYSREVGHMADKIASFVAELVVDDIILNQKSFSEKILTRISIPLKVLRWDAGFLKSTKGFVRAIREADSIPLIYAAYLKKLLPWALSSKKSIVLLSNAFGALNVSYVLKHMLKHHKDCFAGNINFSQNRLDSALFGQGTAEVTLLSSDCQISETADVLMVDDCIFTGVTYKRIKKYFKAKNVHTMMLPLALDIQSLKYYRGEEKKMNDLILDAQESIHTAEEINQTPPVFVAFWDWGNEEYIAQDGENKDYVKIMNGGDLLLKELWKRYKDDILGL